MPDKHYNISYLEDTAQVMQDLKKYSYLPFQNIQEGNIIDLGCGIGRDIINMANLFPGNKAHFIGIDHDAEMIEKAKLSASNMKNVSFLNQEVYSLPFKQDSVAGIRAERLFQHLKRPEDVFKNAQNILKKDYPIVILETDWNSISFYNVNLEAEKKVHDYLTNTKIVNGMAGKKLATNLNFWKFRNIQLQLFPLVTHSFSEACSYLWIDKIIQEMKEYNILTQKEYDVFLGDLKEADSNNYFACSLNMVIISAVK